MCLLLNSPPDSSTSKGLRTAEGVAPRRVMHAEIIIAEDSLVQGMQRC